MAGIRTTEPLAAMGEHFPGPYRELLEIFDRLELHYRDMLDTEFTIEQGKLWMLQVRVGKRAGRAALRIAVELHRDERIALTVEEALLRVSPDHLDQVLHPADRQARAGLAHDGAGCLAGSERWAGCTSPQTMR